MNGSAEAMRDTTHLLLRLSRIGQATSSFRIIPALTRMTAPTPIMLPHRVCINIDLLYNRLFIVEQLRLADEGDINSTFTISLSYSMEEAAQERFLLSSLHNINHLNFLRSSKFELGPKLFCESPESIEDVQHRNFIFPHPPPRQQPELYRACFFITGLTC